MNPANREALARRIAKDFQNVCVKLATLERDIRLLWTEFETLKTGESIMGCRTKKQFCHKVLKRTPRAVRYMLSGGNPLENRIKKGETVSPLDLVFAKVSSFSSEVFFGDVENLRTLLQARTLTDDEQQTLTATVNALDDLAARASLYREQLQKYLRKAA